MEKIIEKMITVPTSFYKGEVRNGFFISPNMKQAWAQQIKVLSVIDDICERHGITYFAEWGTLLGAVRHGGYVPWDDDIDLSMKREDYNRFLEAAKTELPEGFDIYDFRSKDNHWFFTGNVVNRNRICFEIDHLERFDNFPYIVSVDIYLLDYLYKDPKKEKERDDKIVRLLTIAELIINDTVGQDERRYLLAEIEREYKVKIAPGLAKRETATIIYDIIEKRMSEVPESEAGELGIIFPWILNGVGGIPKECFKNIIRKPFEFSSIPVPKDYHAVLTNRFGDYMQIVKGGGSHGYPFYEGQKENLFKVAGEKPPEFCLDPQMLAVTEKRKAEPSAKKTVIFFTTSPEGWPAMEELYRKHAAEDDCNVFIVPLPLYRKNVYGQLIGERLYELDRYPDDLPGYLYEDIDRDSYYADIIYFQEACDDTGPVLSVPSQFYPKELARHCDSLVYVMPSGMYDLSDERKCDSYNIARLLNTPSALYSDIIYAQTEQDAKLFIKILTQITGSDTAEYWENKIKEI